MFAVFWDFSSCGLLESDLHLGEPGTPNFLRNVSTIVATALEN
jgi:hypothetical protein